MLTAHDCLMPSACGLTGFYCYNWTAKTMRPEHLGRLLDDHFPISHDHLIRCHCGWEGMDWSVHFHGAVRDWWDAT